jgi:hypothetical protein
MLLACESTAARHAQPSANRSSLDASVD